MPSVTVLLRTWNAAGYLPSLLSRLAAQSVTGWELLVVDSGSTDATVDLVRAAGARVVFITQERFTHARSTNLGFREAGGEIVAMLSQDALPAGDRWLESLTAPFGDPDTVAAFGRQLPRPDCFPLERWHLEEAYPPAPPPGVIYSNVNSAARRDRWEACPFDESVRIAEDRLWALAAEEARRRVIYVPEAAVVHSHHYSLGQVYDRCREEARARRAAEGSRNGWGLLFKAWPRQTLRDARRLAAEGSVVTWPRAAAYRFAEFAGMVAGGRV